MWHEKTLHVISCRYVKANSFFNNFIVKLLHIFSIPKTSKLRFLVRYLQSYFSLKVGSVFGDTLQRRILRLKSSN